MLRKAGESNAKPEGSVARGGDPERAPTPSREGRRQAKPAGAHAYSRQRAALPRSPSTEESVGIEPKARGLAQVSGLAMAQPCSLSAAGNQGLEPCEAGFGDRPAPCALPIVDLAGLEPAASAVRERSSPR